MSISSDPKHHYIYSKTLRPCDQLVNAPQSAGLFLLIDLSFNLTYYHEKFIFNIRGVFMRLIRIALMVFFSFLFFSADLLAVQDQSRPPTKEPDTSQNAPKDLEIPNQIRELAPVYPGSKVLKVTNNQNNCNVVIEFRGSPRDVIDHYRKFLEEKGWKLRHERVEGQSQRLVMFLNERQFGIGSWPRPGGGGTVAYISLIDTTPK